MELIALVAILAVSLGLNVFAARRLQAKEAETVVRLLAKDAEIEAAKKRPAPTLTAEQLLHDLTGGQAVIRVEVLNPADLFLRSPRT